MPAGHSPLLAQDDEPSRPWLSSGPLIPDESSFSRLISQANPSSPGTDPRFAPFRRVRTINDQENASIEPSYCSMTASATLYTLFVGYLIASFVEADSWQETILQITIGSYEPANFVLQSQSLTSLLQETDNFLSMLLIWLAYFVIPSLFMVLLPLWMVHDFMAYHAPYRQLPVAGVPSARLSTELLAKAALLLIWIHAIQNLAMTGITIQLSTGSLLVRNQSGAGWTTFCVGMSCCLATLCVLRRTHALLGDNDNNNADNAEQQHYAAVSDNSQRRMTMAPLLLPVRSPPPEAFQRFPLRHVVAADEEEIRMTVLEDVASPPPRRHEVEHSGYSTPELTAVQANVLSALPRPGISYFQRILMFQLALVASVLWIPSMYIPIFTVDYHGLGSAFLQEPQKSFFVWDLASYDQELPHGNRFYNNILISVIAAACLVVIPVAGTCLGVTVWLGDGTWNKTSRGILYMLQPVLASGVVLLAALVIALATLDLGDSTQICRKLLLETECLSMTGQLEVGAWIYALHSVVLELFVYFTLRWSWRS